jgi:hypothetical protein
MKQKTNKEPEKVGLSHKIDNIEEKLEIIVGTKTKKGKKKKKKSKDFKMPYSVKSKLKKLAKLKKAQVLLLEGNNIRPVIGEVKDGMLLVGDRIYDGSVNYMWAWNGKAIPTFIVPEWDLRPLCRKELHEDAVENKRIIHPQTFIIRGIEASASLNSKKLSGKTMIWLGVGAIVVFYILFANGG